jgi:hypothetical protein
VLRRGKDDGWFVLWSLFPFGMATWAVFAYAGARARVRRWKLYAAGYAVAIYAALVYSTTTNSDGGDDALAGMLILIPWVAGFFHSLVMRPEYVRRREREPTAIEQARARLQTREQALEIAREEPALAHELGIGRPDRRGAMDAGLVDINSAPAKVIERLPGIDRALARRIVALREELDGFTSLEDLGMTLDLPGDAVEDLRGKTVFLPR